MLIVDAHEDIGYNMLAHHRDYSRSAHETRALEHARARPGDQVKECLLGMPEWLAGRVAVVFATIFTEPAWAQEPGENESIVYTTPKEAYAQGMRQVDAYNRMADESSRWRIIHTQRDLASVLDTWKGEGPEAEARRQIGIVMLMEGADPIIRPKDVQEWYERGLRIIGPAWLAGTRYAGGNKVPGPLTDEGVHLLRAMNDLNMVLDVSHLSDQACLQALDRYDGPVIASHSNPRALVPGDRQLSDDMLKALLERDGVVGVLPLNGMLRAGWRRGDRKDAVHLVDVTAAIDYVCQKAGDARHAGLGTDFDGGFGAESTPAEIDSIADLPKIAQALQERGYAATDIEGIMGGNWLSVLRRALP